MNKTKHNCLLCMLSMQCISYSSGLKMQLEMFSKCAQFKRQKTESLAIWLVPRRELIHSGHDWVMFSADLWWRGWSFEQHAIKASAGQFVLVKNFLVLLYRKLKKKLRYSFVSLKFLSFKLADKMEFFFKRNFCPDCRIENHLLRISKAVYLNHFSFTSSEARRIFRER